MFWYFDFRKKKKKKSKEKEELMKEEIVKDESKTQEKAVDRRTAAEKAFDKSREKRVCSIVLIQNTIFAYFI